MSKRAPAGSRRIAREVKAYVESKGIEKASKRFKVSRGRINAILHGLKTNSLGKVLRSRRGVEIWKKRLQGKGKAASPRTRKEKPEPSLAQLFPTDSLPKPSLESLLEKRETIGLIIGDSVAVILPKWRRPNKRNTDHIINKSFDYPEDAAEWMSEKGLNYISAVFYNKNVQAWQIVVYKSADNVPSVGREYKAEPDNDDY